jgi:hypothetical protein
VVSVNHVIRPCNSEAPESCLQYCIFLLCFLVASQCTDLATSKHQKITNILNSTRTSPPPPPNTNYKVTKFEGQHKNKIPYVKSFRSQWPRGLRHGSAAARLHGLRVRIPPAGCLSLVSVVCCHVESSEAGWSLLQRSPTECGVSECDREALLMRRPWPTTGCCTTGRKM